MLPKIRYIAIADWMLNFGLNVRELVVFAIIYGFTQDGKQWYGSLDTISEWIGINTKCSNDATRYLSKLVKKKLVNKKTKYVNGRKKCIYKTAILNGPILGNPDIDFITIQPWMIATDGLHLNGKDLLLYALVYSYSRRDSGNYCKYIEDYYQKWLCVRKDHIDRQIKRLKDKKLIETFSDGYIAILPEKIAESNASQTDSLLTQSDSLVPQIDSQNSPKVIDNNSNLNNLSNNLLLNNNDVVSDKELSDFIYTHICTSEHWIISIHDKQAYANANEAINKINKIASSLKNKDKKLFVELDSKSIIDIYMKSIDAIDNIHDSFKNPNGFIRSVINSKLLEVKKTK